MKPTSRRTGTTEAFKTWTLPSAVTLGSAVRAHGIVLELRGHLPFPARKLLDVSGNILALDMRDGDEEEARAAAAIVEKALPGIGSRPVIPREIEDILGISSTERRRWLEDGRLPSAGTRTVKLRGRARRITFHVFDPKLVEDVLDGGKVDEWREEDVEAAAERRRQAALKRRLTKPPKAEAKHRATSAKSPDASAGLKDWDEFIRNGLLR